VKSTSDTEAESSTVELYDVAVLSLSCEGDGEILAAAAARAQKIYHR